MKCPICDDVRMREVEKNGVQIDICPECKGVWLDRGELEKLLGGVRELRQEYDRFEEERQHYEKQRHEGGYPGQPGQPGQPAQPHPPHGYPDPHKGQVPPSQYPYYDKDYHQHGHSKDYQKDHYKKKKKESIFDVFDIF